MKKIILSVIIAGALFTSCKKDNPAPSCEISNAGLTANYKITKVEIVSTSGNSDVTSTFLDACKKDGLYQLKSNGTFAYTEAGSSCSGSGNGSWSVAGNAISITGTGGLQFANAPVTGWDCTTLTVSQTINLVGTPVNGKFTFVKQ
jgi:hypothetical protein